MEIKVKPDPRYQLVTKVGSITREHDLLGPALERELRQAQETFIRAMELRGMTLYRAPGLNNPVWTANADGSPMAFYALDWEGKRKPRLGPDGNPMPRIRETSLEESEGEVEYRIVGVFWSPEQSIEVLKEKDLIKQEERAARHPTQFGYGGVVDLASVRTRGETR